MKRILIIGGSGFIGQHLIELLQEKKAYNLSVFDLQKPQFVDFGGKFLVGDITNASQVSSSVKNHDYIVDLAGILGTNETFNDVARVVRVNVEGAVNVFEAAKKHKKKVVYVSLTNDWLNPYTITKQAANRLAQMYFQQLGAKISVLRGLNVYGEYQKFHSVKKIGPQFIVNALMNKPVTIYGNGLQRVDLVDAKDVVRAIFSAMNNEKSYGEIIDIGTGQAVKVIDVAKLVIGLCKSKSKIVKVPLRRGEPKNSVTVADIRNAKKILEFTCNTPLRDGLLRTIQWYKSEIDNLDRL